MKLSALHTFLTILETGSLSRASEKLNITQSTVTARLQALEDELGQTLLHRHRSGVTVTASGLRLKRYAEAMSDLWRQARQEIALPDNVRLICNFGVHHSLWAGLGAILFEKICALRPDIAVSIWSGNSAQISSWLDAGLIDIGLSHAADVRSNQSVVELAPDRLVLVSPSPNTPIEFDPGYIFIEAGTDFGRQHATAYASAGIANISFNNPIWGLEHLLKNHGSAYLPHRLVKDKIKEKTLFILPNAPEFSRRVYFLRNDDIAKNWGWLDTALQALYLADDDAS